MNRTHSFLFVLCVVLASILALPATAATSPPRYTLTNLGTLGGPTSHALALNNAGQVVGYSTTAKGVESAFLWQAGKRTNLGMPSDGERSVAYDINKYGQVAYTAYVEDFERGAIWKGGTFTWLDPWTEALGINDYARVVGTDDDEEQKYPFAWHKGVKTYLSPNPESGFPQGLNNKGHVVGHDRGAVLWAKGQPMQRLAPQGSDSSANAINDYGHAVGHAPTSKGAKRPVLWKDGQTIDLGTLNGASGEALGINIHGVIVGTSQISDGSERAFVYTSGRMTGLTSLTDNRGSWILVRAEDVNDKGQIVGVGLLNGKQRAFLLTPK